MSGAGHPGPEGYNAVSKNRGVGQAGGRRKDLEWK